MNDARQYQTSKRIVSHFLILAGLIHSEALPLTTSQSYLDRLIGQ